MKNTTIILYHDIDTSDRPTEKLDLASKETVARLKEFEIHMAYLYSKGYNVLSLDQYLKIRKAGTVSDKMIVLTFDDGHISNYLYALPILQKYSFSATFFVIAANIGMPYYIGTQEIKVMLKSGMEIGSHGLTHTYLPKLSCDEVKEEVVKSKKILESCTGLPVEIFAYPGGHVNKMVIECVKSAGYKAAASCVLGPNNSRTDPFMLQRIEVRRGTSLNSFRRINNPLSIKFFRYIDLVKTFLQKTMGLDFYQRARRKFYFLYPFKR